jgi:hypothetical protein
MALAEHNKKKNYEFVFTESFLYFYVLANYLTLNDIKNLSYISKYTLTNATNIDFRLRTSKKRYATTIIKFLKKSNNTFKNLNYDLYQTTNLIDDFPNKPYKYLKKIFCLYMVSVYTHYKEWYIGIGGYEAICWKNDILNQYNRKIIDNPSRFDYFKLIYQMSIDEIYDIGW